MDDVRRVEYNWGRERLRELLKIARLYDVRILKTSINGDWKLQFRSLNLNGVTPGSRAQYDKDGWETDWTPLSLVNQRHPELWAVLRTKICSEFTLSHAQVGDVIDSSGNNLGSLHGPAVENTDPSNTEKRRRTPRAAHGVSRPASHDLDIKQDDDFDPRAFLYDNVIDITKTNDIPSAPDEAHFQNEQTQEEMEPEIIDLTLHDIIDLTIEPSANLAQDTRKQSRRNHQLGECDSDRDSLFEQERDLDSDDESLGKGSEEDVCPAPQGFDVPAVPAFLVTQKKGRKRALDLVEDDVDSIQIPVQQQPHKKLRLARGVKGSSLFTAVQGKVVVKKRDGRYTRFDAEKSAGSVLAKKKANTTGEEAVQQNIPQRPLTVDDLEDYEDEDDAPPSTLDAPTSSKVKSMWDDVSQPSIFSKALPELPKIANRGRIHDPLAPPLFLLRISPESTLRLMMREWSCSLPQWCYISRSRPEVIATKEENTSHDDSTYTWVEHDTHLLVVAPQFHHQAWEASSIRQENLITLINKTKDDQKVHKLRQELELERNASWIDGELEKADIVPRIADIVDAEHLLFSFSRGSEILHLDKGRCSIEKRLSGGWAELVPYTYKVEVPGRLDVLEYEQVSGVLAKRRKFLLLWSPLVDALYKYPHTLVVFSSRSQDMFELLSIPNSFPRGRRSLVIVHIGRKLPFYDTLLELDVTQLLEGEDPKPE
ncbi:hypothetical protein PIIN_00153 [Serendipita indica DSM 11827]|uniref:Uncharacterized protein n=1 Tax=Serendipita indica (strain DSM 11827) TaxID=1109443 RepID=G4T561_SERID|nr:hypothetical protein PIIN_00153 [Serendipita indica DSM 11827]